MAFWKKSTPVEEYPKEFKIEPIVQAPAIKREDLRLAEIERLTITITTYINNTIKQIGRYLAAKDEKKIELEKTVVTLIKTTTISALELKNLLGHLETHYYAPVLAYLEKKEKEAAPKKEHLQKDLEKIKDADAHLMKYIGYETLFNPEKNPNASQELKKEAEADLQDNLRTIHDALNILFDKKEGVLTKIHKHNV
ncbi:MAG: hypothetical protein WC595_05040 [Candidatus Nanoarchaeia archaeon]